MNRRKQFSTICFCINESGGKALIQILKQLDVLLIVTRLNRDISPLFPHTIASDYAIPYTCIDINSNSLYNRIISLKPDFIISSWFHRKIPKRIIDIPKMAAVNIHPSLLPKYRGATPIEWCIKNKEKVTGITLHKLDTEFDTGNILWQHEVPIGCDDTSTDVIKNMLELVPFAISNLLMRAEKNNFHGIEQDEILVSYYPKIDRNI